VKTAKLLIDRVFKLHGLPTAIISDRDPRFTAGVWEGGVQRVGHAAAHELVVPPADPRADGEDAPCDGGWAEGVR